MNRAFFPKANFEHHMKSEEANRTEALCFRSDWKTTKLNTQGDDPTIPKLSNVRDY